MKRKSFDLPRIIAKAGVDKGPGWNEDYLSKFDTSSPRLLAGAVDVWPGILIQRGFLAAKGGKGFFRRQCSCPRRTLAFGFYDGRYLFTTEKNAQGKESRGRGPQISPRNA